MTADPTLPSLPHGERLLREFEQAWTPASLDAWLSRLPEAGTPERAALLLGLVEIDLRKHWLAGRQPTVEDYLVGLPELGTPATVAVELILAEYLARQRAGLGPRPAHFAPRFPGREQELSRLVEPASPEGDDRIDLAGSATDHPRLFGLDSDSIHDPPSGEAALSEHFGRYRILKKLGQGGMGTVYLALDTRLDRRVALKVPRFGPGTSPEYLERFYREARATATISHPNLCPLYDIGEVDGVPYLTMPFIEGWPLTRFTAREKRLPQPAVAAVVRKIATAVHAAHQVGVVHRDLKPSNVMINLRGEPIVTDFGLARWVHGDQDDARLSGEGAILGAPVYMSPEQVQGDLAAIGPACDVYSLGVILFELLTNQVPFAGGTTTAVLAKTLMLDAPKPSAHRPDVSPALEAICVRAMAKRPQDRYPSMQAMADALGEYLRQARQPTAPRQERVVAAPTPPTRPAETRIAAPPPRPVPAARPNWMLRVGIALGLLVLFAVPVVAVVSWFAAVPRGYLVLTILPDGSAVHVLLDDEPLPAARLGEAIPLEAGEHKLLVTGTRFEDHARTVTIAGRSTERVEVVMRPRGIAPVRRQPLEAPYPAADGAVRAVAVAPQAGRGLTGGDDFAVTYWDLDQHAVLARLAGHTLPVTGVAVTPRGERGVSCAGDGTVRVWELPDGRPLHVLKGHADWPRCVAIDPTGTRAVSGDDAGRLLVWDANAGRLVRTLDGHAGPVRAVVLHSDGKRALSVSDDGTARIWDATTGKQTHLFGPAGEGLRAVAWSPNGKLVATGGSAGTVRVWNLDTGKDRPFRGHSGPVRGLAFSADGSRLFSVANGPADATLRVWDVPRGALAHSLGEVPGGANGLVLHPDNTSLLTAGEDRHLRGWETSRKSDKPPPATPSLSATVARQITAAAAVERLALSPDGATMLFGGPAGGIGVWDVEKGAVGRTLRGHTKNVRALAFAPDGKSAASGGLDNQVRVWNLARGTAEVLDGHQDGVLAVAWSPDGKRLASASADKSVLVWDLAQKAILHKLVAHSDAATGVAVTPDGRQLLSVGLDGLLKIWNAESGQPEKTGLVAGGGFTCLALFPDGRRAVTGGRDRTVRIWDLTPAQPTATNVTVLGKPVASVAVSPCGRWFAVGGEDGAVQRWDAQTLQVAQVNPVAHPRPVTNLAFTPDGRALVSAATGPQERAVKFWGLPRGQWDPLPAGVVRAEPAVKLAADATIESAALSPDGTVAVAVGGGKDVLVWDVASGRARDALVGSVARLHGVAFLPDGKRVVTGGADNAARVWNLATGKAGRAFTGHAGAVLRTAVSGDGRHLLTGCADRTARLWEVASGRVVWTLAGHGGPVAAVALSRDGFLAVTGSHDRSVRWWDLATGRPLGGYVGPAEVHAVALSPDGTRIAVGGRDKVAVLLDAATGAVVGRFPGHDGTIGSVAFSPDGQRVATGSDDRTARVWDVEAGREVARLTGFAKPVASVAFTSDGKRLVTGSGDPAVALWDLP